jgi:hypothetical protein
MRLHHELSVVRLGHGLRDRQAQPVPIPGARLAASSEGADEPLDALRRENRPAIVDDQRRLAVASFGSKLDPTAVVVVLDRVGDQVRDEADEEPAVAINDRRGNARFQVEVTTRRCRDDASST